MKDHRRCHCAPLVYLGFLFLGLIAPTLRIASAQAQQVFKTQSATIYYDDPASLREMEHRLRFSQANKFSQSSIPKTTSRLPYRRDWLPR